MAHKKGMGSSRNGRDSESKRLGVKLFGGQSAISGNIIVRQRGTKFHPGKNVGLGKDHTLFATSDGIVYFSRKKANRKYVDILNPEVYQRVMEAKKKDAPVSVEALKLEVEGKEAATETSEKEAKEKAPKKEETKAAKKETMTAKKKAAPKAEKKSSAKKSEKKKEDKKDEEE